MQLRNTSLELDSHCQTAHDTTNKKSVVMAIIPAYNESTNIKKTIEQTIKYVSSIIVVDDGSQDNTAEIARMMNVTVIRNRYNIGKGAALKKGLIECCKYDDVDIVITLDGDGQHDPVDIPHLLDPIEKGEADIVIGSRYRQDPHEIPRFRRIGLSIINYANQYLMKTTINDSQSGFRAYKKNILSIISSYDSNGYGVETEQLARAESSGLRIMEVPINIRYRGLVKTSKRNSVLHGANILSTIIKIAVERQPLLFFVLAGTILIGTAIVTSLYMLIVYNVTRYFSIPLSLITLGLVTIGSLLIVSALIFLALNRIRDRYEVATTFKDIARETEKLENI